MPKKKQLLPTKAGEPVFATFPPNVTYTGELANPIYVPMFAGAPMTASRLKIAYMTMIGTEHDAKMRALLALFSIDENDEDGGIKLAVALANAHVPGFKVAFRKPPNTSKGPKKKADHINDARTFYVDEFKKDRGVRHDIQAIRALIAEEHILFRAQNEDTLVQRIKESRARTRAKAAEVVALQTARLGPALLELLAKSSDEANTSSKTAKGTK